MKINNNDNYKPNQKDRQILETSQRTKEMWNLKVTVIPIVIGAVGTVPKDLVKSLERQPGEIAQEKMWIWLRKRNLKIRNEALLIAAQNNAIRTSYAKAKFYKTQQNNEGKLCRETDETATRLKSRRD